MFSIPVSHYDNWWPPEGLDMAFPTPLQTVIVIAVIFGKYSNGYSFINYSVLWEHFLLWTPHHFLPISLVQQKFQKKIISCSILSDKNRNPGKLENDT